MNEFVSLLIAGIVTGSIYAVSASGLVLTYITTGFFNFAQGAMGMVMAYLFWQLWQGWHLPALVALAIVLFVAAPVLGMLVELLVARPLHGASANVRIAVMLGLLLMLLGVAGVAWRQSSVYTTPEFFAGHQVSIGGVSISYEQLITVGVAVVAALVLRVMFRRTRTGVAMRAVVDDPNLASLTGAPSTRIASIAWMLGVLLAAVAGILLAPTTMDMIQLTELVIFGYAAAVVGGLRSFPLTFLGAMVLGVGDSMTVGYAPSGLVTDVQDALPMALLLIALLVLPEVRLRAGRVMRTRPPAVATATTTYVGAAFIVAATMVASSILTGTNLYTLGSMLVLSLLALSLVPLSGYGGQVSLCQYTFLGVGAVVMHFVAGGSSILGVLAAIGACAVGGALVALPALRLSGLYLALATLAFAVLMDDIFFTSNSIMGSGGSLAVGRPQIFGLNFQSDRSFDILLGIVLAACVIGVGYLRRGRFGRRLVAMNDSSTASATIGMSLTRTKLAVFAFSGAMAGLAGALFGGLSTTVGAAQFTFLYSIVIFVAVTLTGASLLTGAIVTGFVLALGPVIGAHIPQVPGFTELLVGVGIVTIGRNPLGVGRVYAEVSALWQRRKGARVSGPAVGGRGAPVTAGVDSGLEGQVTSVG